MYDSRETQPYLSVANAMQTTNLRHCANISHRGK